MQKLVDEHGKTMSNMGKTARSWGTWGECSHGYPHVIHATARTHEGVSPHLPHAYYMYGIPLSLFNMRESHES